MIFGPFFNHLFIHFSIFSKTLPGDHFWRDQVPVYPQKGGFGAILGFRGGPKSTLGATFSDKKAPKEHEAEVRDAPLSRPGRDLSPKMPRPPIFIFFYRFFPDFRPIWEGFFMILEDFLRFLAFVHEFQWRFFKKSALPFL